MGVSSNGGNMTLIEHCGYKYTDLDTCLKHQAQAREYKELMDSVKNLPLDNVPNAGWYRRGTLAKAWKSRLHKHRVKVLNEFLEKYVKAA